MEPPPASTPISSFYQQEVQPNFFPISQPLSLTMPDAACDDLAKGARQDVDDLKINKDKLTKAITEKTKELVDHVRTISGNNKDAVRCAEYGVSGQ